MSVSKKERRERFQPVTPEVEAWRRENPLRKWLDKQPFGTVQVLAEKLELNPKTIYTWLTGRSLPPADTLLRICDMTKVGFRDYIAWWNRHPGFDAK